MASPKLDPEVLAHLEWLGFVRPIGLVVSAPALVRAGAILDRRDSEGQWLLRACVEERTFDPKEGSVPCVRDFRRFAESVLGWTFSPKGYAGTPECPIPTELEVPLPGDSETLRPDFAVRELEPKDGGPAWQLLVCSLDPGEDFDRVVRDQGQLEASAHGRMERLLRQTCVPAGLLFNGLVLRLVSAPRGESSGWLDFCVADMVQTAGRPISTAMRLLLGQSRLLAMPRVQRLAALLDDSRKFQNEVSERLAEQVLHALYEFLRGFQAAHDASKGELLREPLTQHPDEVYRALLTVILRLVFLLYAEERDMLPEDETFLRYYSLAGLYERLREDAALFPDTMDQRYGAWAQLLVLFRMIYDGAEAGAMRVPKRHGVLFDPDRFTFLEGRPSGLARNKHSRIEPPLVPDGTIYRALEKLLVLDGERISYRALDVEQIGSVYETMMGFRLETATGRSVAIKAQKRQGAPTAIDLELLLAVTAAKRERWIAERVDRKLTDTVNKEVMGAATLEDLHAALLPVIDPAATPDLVPKGAMVLQPSEERRRSGSHYTPRVLTEPIVWTTLDPILARLRGNSDRPPRPAQILDLRVCDPAMGSGAFLVEVCRQLGDALVEAWHAYGEVPAIPPDEDEVIFARRLIAHRCLYGLDKNPVAVDLAKVSLWLVTLAKDHALTFVDHALRHGDSLVGLSCRQIESFHWDPDAPSFQAGFETMRMREHVATVAELRQRIRDASESVSDLELRKLWDETQQELGKVRLFGDLVLAAFFQSENSKDRQRKRDEYASAVVSGGTERYLSWLKDRVHGEHPFVPFHWEIEFPEVFDRSSPGFDCFIGNPPFVTGTDISGYLGNCYRQWLSELIEGFRNRANLCVAFLRRSASMTRPMGTVGLVVTNTLSEGDSRIAGLYALLQTGEWAVYSASTNLIWPGEANLHVHHLHLLHGEPSCTAMLDSTPVNQINDHLAPSTARRVMQRPQELVANRGISFTGERPYDNGGFELSPQEMEEMRLHLARDGLQVAEQYIRPYLSGEDLNGDVGTASRYVIDFTGLTLEQARLSGPLFERAERIVRPFRQGIKEKQARERWWLFQRSRPALRAIAQSLPRVLVAAGVSKHLSFTFVDSSPVFHNNLCIFALPLAADLCVLQSRAFETWARRFSSTLDTRLKLSTRDAFDTYPFPRDWRTNLYIEHAGAKYYEFRAAFMAKNNQGLTKTYNRFHDPEERNPDIGQLRELHVAMDRAVLDAYGWSDIPTGCEFLLDYEIDGEEWGDKKKPWRYRWPDEARDEVLARLLELNAERAKEDVRSGAAAAVRVVEEKLPARRAVNAPNTEDLFS